MEKLGSLTGKKLAWVDSLYRKIHHFEYLCLNVINTSYLSNLYFGTIFFWITFFRNKRLVGFNYWRQNNQLKKFQLPNLVFLRISSVVNSVFHAVLHLGDVVAQVFFFLGSSVLVSGVSDEVTFRLSFKSSFCFAFWKTIGCDGCHLIDPQFKIQCVKTIQLAPQYVVFTVSNLFRGLFFVFAKFFYGY